MISIQIQQIKSPGHFFCREVDSETASIEHHHFQQLHDEIQETFNKEQMVQVPYIAQTGEICIGLRSKDKKWYRVRNDGIFARKYGQEASCILVDIGGNPESINIRWLRKSPKKFLELPFQIKECCLYGVKALTLAIQEDMSLAERSCLVWDDSATSFMEKCVKKSLSASAEILYTDNTGRIHVKLYLQNGSSAYNFNDLLVANKYAIVDETDGLVPTAEAKSTMSRNKRHLKKLLAEGQMESLSDTEIFNGLKFTSSAISEAEGDDYISRSGMHAGYTSETEYQKMNLSNMKNHTTLSPNSGVLSPKPSPSKGELDIVSRHKDVMESKNVRTRLSLSPRSSCSVVDKQNCVLSSDDDLSLHSKLSLSPKLSSTVSNTNRYGSSDLINSQSDIESVSSQKNLQVSPLTFGRGRSRSPVASVSNSQGHGMTISGITSSVSRGKPPPAYSVVPTISRGRSQVELLRLAMNSKLPSSSPSSASEMESDSRQSPDITRKKSQYESLGAKPKVYANSVLGQFEDSESDSSASVVKSPQGISVGALLRNDPNVSIARGRLPKAARLNAGMSSGSDTNSTQNITPTNRGETQAIRLSSGSDTDYAGKNNLLDQLKRKSPQQAGKPKNMKDRLSVRFSDGGSSETDSVSTVKSSSPSKISDEEKRRSEMIGKLKGNALLDILKQGSKNSGSTYGPFVAPVRAVTERMDNLDHVLVHSADRIKPITRLEDAPIGKLMREAFVKLDFPAPKLIQAYAWKCILRGLNFVGLSPPDSGKTYAYLVPIISQLQHPGPYKCLKGGSGPIAVILVPSWKKVQQLYYTTCSLLREEKKKIRVIDLYGSEDLKMIPLVSGCEIVIATPPSLKRVLEHQYTQLNRLCHLVVDEAEITLIEYKEEIQDILSIYSNELRKQDDRAAPQQLILLGTQWEPVVKSFVSTFMPEPVITITSRYEASLYGKVNQIPIMCKSVQKPNVLVEKLDDVVKDGCRLIIFASTVNLACVVDKLVRSCSLYALLAHHEMDKFDINERSSNWHCSEDEEQVILITTDLSIPHLYIDNATAIIHYDLPDSKTKFGNRMSCMSKHYWNFLKRDKERTIIPTSYIMISEECTEKVDTISQLLTRSKVEIPLQLKAMLEGRWKAKNLDKDKKLCTYMKAYGKCRFEERCQSRHLVIPEIDEPSQLTCGWVKVRITNVEDASHMHGIVLEHKAPDGTVVDYRCNYTKLLFKMASHFGNLQNQMRHTNMCIGDICAYEYNDIFHRVQILDIVNLNSKEGIMEADVKFVDDGKEERVPVKQLYDLPQKLKSIPFQTVDIFVCKVKPVDRDDDWTPRANMFMHQLVIQQSDLERSTNHKELDGRIVLSMANTLWLDPLVELIDLPNAQTVGRKMNVRNELISNGFAVKNPKHLQYLYEACRGKIKVPDINKEHQRSDRTVTEDNLPESKQYHDVYISAVDLPNLFFVQKKETYKQLEKMMDKLNDTMDNEDDPVLFVEDDVKDAVCVAKFPDDGRWYRVKVVSDLQDGSVEAFYGDYGDKRTIPRDGLYQLPQDFMKLSLQAIECELADVQPRGDDWEEESGDLFWDLTHTVCDDKKCIVAKIVSKNNSEFTGIYRYGVELFDTETSDDINLAQELIWSSLASPKPESSLQELSPVPSLARKTYKSPVQKVPDLCGIIYWEKNTERARSMPKNIYSIVEQNVKSAPLELIGYKVLASIIKLIGRISHPESHQWMLESLFVAAKSSKRLCQEIIEQECGLGVIKCLEQNCRPNIQEQAIIAIDKFLEISHSFVSVFGNRSTIEILCQLLDASERNSMLTEIYRVMSSLCAASGKICEFMHEFDICKYAQQHLQNPEHQEIEETALKCLFKLMERNAEQMRREKLVKAVVSVMERTQNKKCILYGAKICDNFCHELRPTGEIHPIRKHKTILLESRLAVILQKILKSAQLSTDTRQLCQTLHDSLVVNVPHVMSINNRPSNIDHQQYTEGALPQITWSQNTFRVIVSVKIKGVKSCDVLYTTNSLYFKAVVDGKLFTFSYELYDEIDTSKCVHDIKGSRVDISVRKVEKGKWPRILKQKQKQPNISVDYERFVDSSSDSEVSDDDKPFVLKKTKKKQLPKNIKRPKKTKVNEDDDDDEEENNDEDSVSTSDDEVIHRTTADYDRYNPFN